MPIRILAACSLCLFMCGCFLGTPVAKRGVEIRQDRRIGTAGPFEVDYSAMPAGAVEARKSKGDRHGEIQTLEISGHHAAKILIVPAIQTTQPAPGQN